jgi:carbonic anhydrase
MDSRVHPERIFGLEIGDVEVIRNAGGRVTPDVLRSLLVCQDLLGCDTIMVVHHTDCGGQVSPALQTRGVEGTSHHEHVVATHGQSQAAARRREELMSKLNSHMARGKSFTTRLAGKLTWLASYLVPKPLRVMVSITRGRRRGAATWCSRHQHG